MKKNNYSNHNFLPPLLMFLLLAAGLCGLLAACTTAAHKCDKYAKGDNAKMRACLNL
jgi:hypothetical protein